MLDERSSLRASLLLGTALRARRSARTNPGATVEARFEAGLETRLEGLCVRSDGHQIP